MTRRSFLAAAASSALGAAAPRTAMGIATTSFMIARRPNDTLEFLEYCHSLGAGGIQASLTSLDAAYIKRLRERTEELGMYLEVMAGLPGENADLFESTVAAAKEAGALCIRSACLGGRRYETFASLDDWNRFVSDSKKAIERALPVVQKWRMPLALENHKDWTLEELTALLEQYSSGYLGACLDTGNNIALLDDPMEFVEKLAPYAVSTHLKDMAVAEYESGFLLSEVPLGAGFLDMKRIVGVIVKARPATRMTLEMITRDPLKVPCLTEKYWVTFPGRNGAHLARTLAMVRANRPREPLPALAELDGGGRARLERENVERCLFYAREQLVLRDVG